MLDPASVHDVVEVSVWPSNPSSSKPGAAKKIGAGLAPDPDLMTSMAATA